MYINTMLSVGLRYLYVIFYMSLLIYVSFDTAKRGDRIQYVISNRAPFAVCNTRPFSTIEAHFVSSGSLLNVTCSVIETTRTKHLQQVFKALTA